LKAGLPVGFIPKIKVKNQNDSSDEDEDCQPAIGENYEENFPSLGTDRNGEIIRESNRRHKMQ